MQNLKLKFNALNSSCLAVCLATFTLSVFGTDNLECESGLKKKIYIYILNGVFLQSVSHQNKNNTKFTPENTDCQNVNAHKI